MRDTEIFSSLPCLFPQGLMPRTFQTSISPVSFKDLTLMRAGRCMPCNSMREEIKKLYNARGIQQSGVSGWEEGHK